MAGVSPDQLEPNNTELDDEEIVNDSLGEETPADSTGLADDGPKKKPKGPPPPNVDPRRAE